MPVGTLDNCSSNCLDEPADRRARPMTAVFGVEIAQCSVQVVMKNVPQLGISVSVYRQVGRVGKKDGCLAEDDNFRKLYVQCTQDSLQAV